MVSSRSDASDCLVSFPQRSRLVGVGVIDVKSPTVESPDLVAARVRRALEYVAPEKLMINPDCGLRHLAPDVERRKLHAMVCGAAVVRGELGEHVMTPSSTLQSL